MLEKLQIILESRRDNALYTVVTSNYNYRELEARWRSYQTKDGERVEIKAGMMHAGRRLLERIAEYCLPLGVRGRNLRRTAGQSDEKVRPIR